MNIEETPVLLKKFELCCELKNSLLGYMSQQQFKSLYGLFKQATEGDIKKKKPLLPGLVKEKWNAWNLQKGKSRDVVMEEYIQIMLDLNSIKEKAEAKKEALREQASRRKLSPKTSPQKTTYSNPSIYKGENFGAGYAYQDGWTNQATELYIEEYGEDVFNKNSEQQFPTPKDNFQSREELEIYLDRISTYFMKQSQYDFEQKSLVTAAGNFEVSESFNKLIGRSTLNGQQFKAYLRHNNTTLGNAEFDKYVNDRNVTSYRASLRIEGLGRANSILDIPMVSTSIFYPNIPSFTGFTFNRNGIYSIYRDGPPIYYMVAIDAQRMAPSSYLKVVYQAPVPIVLIQEDGSKVYVKFKLLAQKLQKEEGLLDQDHQRKLLKTTAIQDSSKKKDFYLKEEYQDAIEANRANYTLQMQIWDPSKTPDQDFWKMLNPAIPWDATKYKWEDIGDLSIKEQLSVKASNDIRFNVANHPSFIELPKPISIYDPMRINWIRKMTYQILQAAKLETIYTSKLNPDKNHPKVLCLEFDEVPDQDFSLAIEFIGEQTQSSMLQISNIRKGGIPFGKQILFKVAYEKIPNLKMVRLHLSDKTRFPINVLKIMEPGRIYSFINHKEEDSGSFILFNSKGSLPQERSELVGQLEKKELQKSKAFYQWKHRVEGLPHFSAFEEIAEVPLWDQYQLRNRLFANTKMMDGFRSAQNEKKAHPKRFSDYRSLVESRVGKATIPAYVFRNWQSDDFFAEQLLSGCNAGLIEQCQKIPTAIEEELRKNGYDLSEALTKGELYQVNYEILADLSPDIPSPFILLQSDPYDGILVPLAIQLVPSDPVFTPDDAPNDWLLAKMWCRMVDCNIAQMCIHLLFSHMLMDNFNLALHRNFSPSHPIYQLLIPHFKNVIAGNIVAKDVLIGNNGMFNRITKLKDVYFDLGRKAWKTWSVKQKLILPYDLEQRGMNDEKALGHYPYRDDGMLIWNAIKNYVKAVVDSYYKEDEQVQQDNELQAWIYETVHQGLKTSDLEDTLESKKDLIDLLSGIIFNSSAIHSSLNSEMFKTMGFIPNSPLVLRGTYPKEKGQTTLNDLMQALPDIETSELIIDMMAILGHRDLEGFIATDEDVLGEETLLSTHPKVRMAHARFKDELEAIALSIEKINKERKYPYGAFLPEHITSSASW